MILLLRSKILQSSLIHEILSLPMSDLDRWFFYNLYKKIPVVLGINPQSAKGSQGTKGLQLPEAQDHTFCSPGFIQPGYFFRTELLVIAGPASTDWYCIRLGIGIANPNRVSIFWAWLFECVLIRPIILQLPKTKSYSWSFMIAVARSSFFIDIGAFDFQVAYSLQNLRLCPASHVFQVMKSSASWKNSTQARFRPFDNAYKRVMFFLE